MIRKFFIGLGVTLFLIVTVWLGYYFYKQSNKPPVVFKTEKPFITDITKKSVATGSIVPRREVLIKPQASGVIEALFVEAGQLVRSGALIARVKTVQSLAGKNVDLISMNNAQNNLSTAQVNFENARVEMERQKKLFEQKVISQVEYNRFLLDYNVRKEALQAAQNNLRLVNQGILQNSGAITNEIYSTLDGTILDVPVKVGTSVIERNNFNEGTTIAIVADMKSLVFEGKIDESEVGKIKEGMELNLNVGAIDGKTFKAILEYISPKGVDKDGAIKFDIRAQIQLGEKDYIRAGYSANADIVLEKKNKILSIKESMLQFEKDAKGNEKVYIEVEKQPQVFEKKYIKTGISDGINIEVLSGVDKNMKIKVPITKDDKKKEEKK